jgi:hypothetical protein
MMRHGAAWINLSAASAIIVAAVPASIGTSAHRPEREKASNSYW